MKIARVPKWKQALYAEMQERFLALMAEIGATHDDGAMYPWSVETSVGTLMLHPCDDWIAGRFLDVARAKPKIPSMNPHSGKWNHHAFWEQDKRPEDACTMNAFFEQFAFAVRNLLPK